jgi:hypothetical protein
MEETEKGGVCPNLFVNKSRNFGYWKPNLRSYVEVRK